MTKDESIKILNLCIAENIEAYFVESKLENGHMIKFPDEQLPILTYNAAMSKIAALKAVGNYQ